MSATGNSMWMQAHHLQENGVGLMSPEIKITAPHAYQRTPSTY